MEWILLLILFSIFYLLISDRSYRIFKENNLLDDEMKEWRKQFFSVQPPIKTIEIIKAFVKLDNGRLKKKLKKYLIRRVIFWLLLLFFIANSAIPRVGSFFFQLI
ncbi:MAG: hypothetical protein K8S23_12735 [Candidatus Cloacimonetes bacterium]|nr:hypothetical protein [Candidatus Cloacimonadota bacterium]